MRSEVVVLHDVNFSPSTDVCYVDTPSLISERVAVCEYKGCFFIGKEIAGRFLVLLDLTEKEAIALKDMLDIQLTQKET